jgi:hypothetical protein
MRPYSHAHAHALLPIVAPGSPGRQRLPPRAPTRFCLLAGVLLLLAAAATVLVFYAV